jgi:hypothetical protein
MDYCFLDKADKMVRRWTAAVKEDLLKGDLGFIKFYTKGMGD